MTKRRFGPYTVELTSLDKPLFPDGTTKGELVDYYAAIAPVMLPHLAGRPLTLQRFPDGIERKGFFQKDASEGFPDWVHLERVEKEGGHLAQIVCDNAATLVLVANLGCITPHVWLSRVDAPRRPDRLVFDLDPEVDDFEAVRRAARWTADVLERLGLAVYLATTGSRGLHVVAPLDRSADFDTVRGFAREVAARLAAAHPRELTVEQRKAKRAGRVYLDVARNGYAQTVVAPYAVRARPGAPVATPLLLDELERTDLAPDRFTLRNVFERLEVDGDPWKGMGRRARSLRGPREALDEALPPPPG